MAVEKVILKPLEARLSKTLPTVLCDMGCQIHVEVLNKLGKKTVMLKLLECVGKSSYCCILL